MRMTATRHRTLGEGVFWCPTCRDHRSYSLIAARRWAHVAAVPLLPVKGAGRFVACDGCQGGWDPRVLELPAVAV